VSTSKQNRPILRSGMTIGSASAESDDAFLFEAFLDTGALESVLNFNDKKFLVLGRTGSGKTALIRKVLNDRPNVIKIDPERLSINHIENSNIVSWLIDHEFNIDIFFQLLWRHVFSVELLKRRYGLNNEHKAQNFLQTLTNIFSAKRAKALKYLSEFDVEFWQDSDVRVQQITNRFEFGLKNEAGIDFERLKGRSEASLRDDHEFVSEIEQRIKTVTGKVQMAQLSEVIDLLSETFSDPKHALYIVVDDLDLPFASEKTRIKLIRALIDSVRKMRSIPYVKFIVAMRDDLLAQVFDRTRDAGFQVEKYEDDILPLQWNANQLFELTEKRIGLLFKRQYTKDGVKFYDVFPQEVKRVKSREYMLSRTLMRPRDIIKFVNESLIAAQGDSEISPKAVQDAELKYSINRLAALFDEWRGRYPSAEIASSILRGRNQSFQYGEINEEAVDKVILELASLEYSNDPLVAVCKKYFEATSTARETALHLVLDCLYNLGLIGIKPYADAKYEWSSNSWKNIRAQSWAADSRIQIHSTFIRGLSVNPREEGEFAKQ
jgi:Cdc6-like AAA superfamily ATPase